MKKYSSAQSGYVAYIGVLVITCVMVWIFTSTFFTKNATIPNEFQPKSANGEVPATEFDRLRADMNAASAVSNTLNIKAQETNAILNSTQ